MNEIFRPVETKLLRVLKQINELEKSILYYSAHNLLNVECVFNKRQLGYKLIQKNMPLNIPIDEWNMQFGECIHNLRTSLDNFAFSLARLKQDPPANPKQLSFPIFSKRFFFEKNKRKILEQFPLEIQLIIKKLQPFNRDGSKEFGNPEDDLLIILSELNNLDKHRIPSVVLITPQNIGFNATITFETEEALTANTPPDTTVYIEPLQSGKILFDHRTKDPIKNVEGNFNIQAQVGIKYGDKYFEIIELLKSFYTYINIIISQFHKFLG